MRDALKAKGVVSPQEQSVAVFDSLSWTEAQKKNVSQYEPGQRIRFVRHTRKFDRGETVEVQAVVENGLRVRRPDGTEVDFIPASAAASFDVGEARELKVAAGDWLLFKPIREGTSSTVSVSRCGRSKTAALPWLMDGNFRQGTTLSRTVTLSRRIRRKVKRWTTCSWWHRQNPSPPSTASSFTSPFLVAGNASMSSRMTPNCSPAASRIHTHVRPLSNYKHSGMTFPGSASFGESR